MIIALLGLTICTGIAASDYDTDEQIISTFLIQLFQQNTNSCLLMLPSPDVLKIRNKSDTCERSILKKENMNIVV